MSESNSLDTVHRRLTSSFRHRVAAMAVAVIAVLATLGTVLAVQQYESARARAANDMRTRAVLAATVFDTYFAGQLAALEAIAKAPSVVATDIPAMRMYFRRVQGDPKRPSFTGGLGWIDRRGMSRVSDDRLEGPSIDVSDRSFFEAVTSTGRPYISEGLRKRRDGKPAVVMAVPTRDAQGRITGVLAGALQLRPSRTSQRTIDLGYEGLVVIDRADQQLTLTSFAKPRNLGLLDRIRRGDGVFTEERGLDGSSGRVVAYANSKAPGWTTVLDRPRVEVFASARRGFLMMVGSIILSALALLGIVVWAMARSRRELLDERERVRRWDELAQSLGEASAAGEVANALGAALATGFDGGHVVVALHDDGRGGFRFWTYGGGADGPLDRADDRIAAVARLAFESGVPVHLQRDELATALEPLGDLFSWRPNELLAVPLHTHSGTMIGSVTLVLPEHIRLDTADEALVIAQAESAARALGRARRSEREHEVAITLQRSLLPAALPEVEGLSLAGRYSAGAVGLEVGGDWYGAVRRPDGLVHLTVGDVAGRGVPAAVLMGQLRYAFRTLAFEHSSPAEVARRMTRLVPEHGMATAAFLTLDPYTGELSYSSAGHPPPLLLDHLSGEITLLEDAPSPPLGWADAGMLTEARVTLPSQTTLLAYTDGLVERRGHRIDEGIERVATELRQRADSGADAIADALVPAARPMTASDDVALLVVTLLDVPSTMHVEIPADPAAARVLRARLSAWLVRRGLREDQRMDTVLAVSEACNNAIEHAYDGRGGTIRLTLEHRDERLHIAIEDHGTWREGRSDDTRGRGIVIMRETMDVTTITSAAGGTRVELELDVLEPRPR